ncbi:MAG: DUF1549 domain-containing protein [Armatimonadota bacterium]
MTNLRGALALALALGAVAATVAAPPSTRPSPAKTPAAPTLIAVGGPLRLPGPHDTARLLVDRVLPGGERRDASGDALYTSLDPRIATVDDQGVVRAGRPGTTTLVAAVPGGSTRIPVTVAGGTPPTFLSDVVPILSRFGCASGACHGANAGRGGFHLSLLGYDPDSDWIALTRLAGGRRIQRAQPDASLLLRKAIGELDHGGGPRFTRDSVEYRTLRDWIALGAPGPGADPRIVALDVVPARRILPVGSRQRVRVIARTADGKTRDVTRRTLFSSGDGAILEVDKDGMAKVVGPGEGAVVVRYAGAFTVARITAPYGPPKPVVPATDPIDRLVNEKAAALGLVPGPGCTDDEFLRRASLDIAGALPTPETIRTFLADPRPDKRARLVDQLLASPEYVDHWTLKWADLLRVARKTLFPKGVDAYHGWIRKCVSENVGWDRFARELLTATGSAYKNGPVNFLRAGTEMYQPVADPKDLGEATAQTLLGVRLQCARCHNHPYEKWTQTQFLQLGAFFARIDANAGGETNERVIGNNTWGEVHHPRGTGPVPPVALDAQPLPATFTGDRRTALAEWVVAPENPFFARLLANRLWKHYLGRGLVEPVDDFRVTNPATNDPLLDLLATELRTGGYDLRKLMRRIVLTDAYQRSSRATPGSLRDTRYHSRFVPRRLPAETLLDAVCAATGTTETFDGYPAGTRAAQLKETSVASPFLDAFGRPPRYTACECERSNEPTLGQALLLLNNPILDARIADPKGRVARLIDRKASPGEVVEELVLATLGRLPTPTERATWTAGIASAKDVRAAAQDLLWALICGKEFVFNR